MGPPSGPVEAGLAAVVVAVGLMWLGFGLAGLVPSWRSDPVTRWALAFPAVVLLALTMMLVHLVTGGALFQSSGAIRVGAGLVAGALLVRWLLARVRTRADERTTRRDLLLGIGCSLLVGIVWGSPVFRMLPLATSGDIGLHAGWTEQLINGETTPTGPLTGDIPNYYPWLYHALLALLTHLTPGAHAFLGLAPLHLLQVLGVAAALYGIGHLFAGRWAGAAVAILGSAAGGWGFALVRGLDLVVDPRAEGGEAATRYLGDLLFVRSYNASFTNLSPSYPRDVALALLASALFAMARGASSERGRDYVVAGGVLGMVGLTQADPFLVGLLVAVALAASARRGRRFRIGAAVLLPAVALFSLWTVPLGLSYVRLGGFVTTTFLPPIALPVWAIVAGWGVVAPLAVVGAVRAARSRRHPVVRVIGASLVAATVALGASALVSPLAGEGFETLGRQHRYWPLFCLPLALLAGLGAYWLAARLRERSEAAALAVPLCVLGLALPSPVIGSLALPSKLQIRAPVTEALDGGSDEALNALSDYGSGVCSVAAPRAVTTFAYTGFRFLFYRWNQQPENAARIRWAEIYEHIVPQGQRERDYELLMRGSATSEQFAAIVRRYGFDIVAVPVRSAAAEAFRGHAGQRVQMGEDVYVLYGVDSC